MAVTETRQLVNPTLEASLTGFLTKLDPLGGQKINTATYAPQVAAQNALQTNRPLCLAVFIVVLVTIPACVLY